MSASILRLLVATLLLVASAIPPQARACEPVTSIPATLSNGKFCLTFDISVAGVPALTLGSDVVLDCQGHRITDLGATYWGVSIQGSNAVVRNCVLTGFRSAISVSPSTKYARILHNTILEPRGSAIQTFARDALVEGNLISAKNYEDGHQWLIDTYAITDIKRNVILNAKTPAFTAYGARYGLSSHNNAGGVISHNVIRNVLPYAGQQGIGIYTSSGYEVVYRNILTAEPGKGDIGIFCSSGKELSLLNVVAGYPRTVGYCQ